MSKPKEYNIFCRAQFGLSLFIFLVPHSLQYIIHKSQRIQRKNDKKSPDDWFSCLIDQRYDLFQKSSTKQWRDRIGNEQHPCWVPFLTARMYENVEWMFVVSSNCVCSKTQSNGCGGHLMFKWILCSTPNNGRLHFVKQIIYKKKTFFSLLKQCSQLLRQLWKKLQLLSSANR